MAAGNTYVALATNTLGSAAASVTFSSISGAYTDLVLVVNAASASGTVSSKIQFNGDTATSYSDTILYGDGTNAASLRNSTMDSAFLNYYGEATTTLLSQTLIVNIQNYANTTTYKTFIARASSAPSGVVLIVGLWRSTSAITSVLLKSSSANNYAAGSTFTLYGIQSA